MCRGFTHKILLCLAALILLGGMTTIPDKGLDNDCEQIFDQMFSAIKQIKTLRFNLYSIERIEDNYTKANSIVKVNTSPREIYYKDLKKGIEVLWREAEDNNDALVNPNGFPYINLHLDPEGKLMHKDQHQTINRLGYSYIGNVLYHSLARYPDAYQKYVKYRCDTTWQGAACYEVEINFPDFGYNKFVVTAKGETVISLAGRYYLNDYLVLSTNHLSSYEDELKIGQVLTIPNGYAKCTLIAIRKDNNLPVHIKVYDEKSLLEEYSFTNLQVNSTIQDAEFTTKYADYHF